ncbi:SMI1/KNR4 family protein [Shewanella woodyi]|uniref:SMI1/KNR4 family protein n=1 Tax=Shewanella woodyi TaxID=60961 RepID=UPI0007EC020D|nr:SMI1/KNR4 family protein [Shewanella woodyi]
MKPELRIKTFVDDFILPRKGPLPGLPEKFRENPDNGEEWDDWIEVASCVTNQDLDAIEERFETTLPHLLKLYLKYKIIFDGDFGIYRFPDMTPANPLKNLISQIDVINQSSFFKAHKLLPFAQDGNDGGPICFKYDEDGIEKGFPIYFVDYDLIHNRDYEGEIIYESFIQLIDAIERNMQSYD